MSADRRVTDAVAVNRVATAFARLAAAAVLAVAALACSPTTPDSSVPESSVPDSDASTGRVETDNTSPPEESMPEDETDQTDQTIRFEVEGGYLALIRSIVIEPDGGATIEVSGRTSVADLDPGTVERLQQQLDDTGLFRADSRLETEGADLQQYTVTYHGATLVAMDGVVPIELASTFAELEQLILDNR